MLGQVPHHCMQAQLQIGLWLGLFLLALLSSFGKGVDWPLYLIYLIGYVGAIAILFLFVKMMLNITDLKGFLDMFNYLLPGLIVGLAIFWRSSVFLAGVLVIYL